MWALEHYNIQFNLQHLELKLNPDGSDQIPRGLMSTAGNQMVLPSS